MRPCGIFRRLLVSAVIILLPANALAAALAYVSASALNLRSGPGKNYEIIVGLPQGTPVAIRGYTSGGRWCDVSVDDLRGWVWCAYLDPGVAGPILTWGPVLGLSIIAYSYDDYYDRSYYGRDRDRDLERDKHYPRRKIVRHRDRDREVEDDKRDRKRKVARQRERQREVKSEKRDRKRKAIRQRDRQREVKSGKRDRKRKIVRQRDRQRDFKPPKRDRKRKIRRDGGGGRCGPNRRCR